MNTQREPLFELLDQLLKQQLMRVVDVKFAQWLAQKLPASSNNQLLLGALLSAELGDGHVCVALDNLFETIEHWPVDQIKSATALLGDKSSAQSLLDNQIIGDGSCITPLVIDNNRLYLYRYWRYECQVAARLLMPAANQINTSLSKEASALKALELTRQLDKYFSSDELPDWQRIAAAITTEHPISIISGGPGTGKTTTVTKLLAIYIESQLQQNRRPIIQLAAPTGKAAARLSESIAQAKQKLNLPAEVLELIPEQGKTLHRLLGSRASSNKFIHHRENPLLLDLLIIDEASMIDLPMMASIVDALAKQTRLVLIGDRDQLASVEAGSVLGDICAVPQIACYSAGQSELLKASCGFESIKNSQYSFADQLAFLQKSYRFSDSSGIGALAKACNQGDVKEVSAVLNSDYTDIKVVLPTQDTQQALSNILLGYKTYFDIIKTEQDPKTLLTSFNQFQVLCALRVGPYGVEQINQQLELHFEKLKLKEPDNRWYLGRPIMITRNDNQMQLYNGDIGITCFDSQTQQLKVWFEQGGEMRAVLPSRLPQHETVFAMTVHKSQGSEFSHVMLMLVQSAKVINKELVYTAITRAKQQFTFFGIPRVLQQAIAKTTKRTSGLADKIWQIKTPN
ncbi:MAG: exodeoxyribonuclease V subunit alpha [Oceanospirillaceae bacterium]